MPPDEEIKLDINDATRCVASFLNKYHTWTDCYEDSAANYWDGVVSFYPGNKSELRMAISSIESSLQNGLNQNELKELGLAGDPGNYMAMLEHMKVIV